MNSENKNDRWELAAKLEKILGTDLDIDEEQAIRDAIRIVSPEFAAMRDDEEADCVDWFENTPYEEQKQFVEEEQRRAESGTTINGRVLRFGQENKK